MLWIPRRKVQKQEVRSKGPGATGPRATRTTPGGGHTCSWQTSNGSLGARGPRVTRRNQAKEHSDHEGPRGHTATTTRTESRKGTLGRRVMANPTQTSCLRKNEASKENIEKQSKTKQTQGTGEGKQRKHTITCKTAVLYHWFFDMFQKLLMTE